MCCKFTTDSISEKLIFGKLWERVYFLVFLTHGVVLYMYSRSLDGATEHLLTPCPRCYCRLNAAAAVAHAALLTRLIM